MTQPPSEQLPLALGLLFLAVALARRFGFYRQVAGAPAEISGWISVQAFALYVASVLAGGALVGLMAKARSIWMEAPLFPGEELQLINRGADLAFVYLLAICVLIAYSASLGRVSSMMWWGQKPVSLLRIGRDIALAGACLLVAYPHLMVADGLVSGLMLRGFGVSPVEQVPVKELEKLLSDPSQFLIYAGLIGLVVPTLEELIFRGFIHNWCRNRFSRISACVVSASIFGVAHFHYAQGWGNVELMVAISVFGGFLAYLYERQGSLLAPIVCHSLFNMITIAAIWFKGAGE